MKILIIAEEANPEWVSVPLIGWSYSRALSQITETLLVTQIRNRKALEKNGLIHGKDFIAINSEPVAKPIFGLSDFITGRGKGWTTRMTFSYLYYPVFEWIIWNKLGKRIKSGEFAIVHRIIPLSPTIPSILARKCKRAGVPFIIGPLNGGLPWPKEFDRERRKEREWLSYVRNAYKILPGYKSTRKTASAIVLGSKATWQQTEEKYYPKCFYMPENGIDLTRFSRVREKRVDTIIKAVFIGRLVPYKGVDMLLSGFRDALKANKIELSILGDGPEREHLEDMVKKLEIDEHVTFHGWIDHSQIQNYLLESDILAFPSIREFGGGVVLEAMALGIMPLIVNYGGPSELITPECGIAIEMGSKKEIIERLREKAHYLIDNKEIIDILGDNARDIVQKQFTWERKAQKTLSLYNWLLGNENNKPKLMAENCNANGDWNEE